MATSSFDPEPLATPLRTAANAVRAWDRFWFQAADPTTLGLIRLCCGLVVLYVHLVYTLDLQDLCGKDAWIGTAAINRLRHEFPVVSPSSDWSGVTQLPLPPATAEERKRVEEYKDYWGVDPRLLPAHGQYVWSVWFHVTDPNTMMAIHVFFLACMCLFTLGCGTRITAALTWVGAMSYVQRAPTTLFGMDTMMMILLLYLMIAPSGAALSVDRLLARWWSKRQARREGLPEPAWQLPAPSVSANFALRLMEVHLCIIYLASGLSKLQGASWWNGTALWATLANYEFAPLHQERYVEFLLFLCQHRWLWELVMSSGVVLTLFVEIGFPFMVWTRSLRWLMITCAVFLHIGIAMSMGLTTFSLLMLALLLSFVPGVTVRRLLRGIRWRKNPQLQGPHGAYSDALGAPSGRRTELAGSR